MYFHYPGIEPWLIGILEKAHTKKVLDVGAGFGFWGYLIKICINPTILVGLDISRDRLLKLIPLNIYDGLLCADARYLPFREKAFDSLISVETIHHLSNLKEILIGYERILTSDAIIALSFPVSQKMIRNLLDLGYDVFGVFPIGFFMSGGFILLNIRNSKTITRPTRSAIMALFALILRILYRLLKLRMLHYSIAVKAIDKQT